MVAVNVSSFLSCRSSRTKQKTSFFGDGARLPNDESSAGSEVEADDADSYDGGDAMVDDSESDLSGEQREEDLNDAEEEFSGDVEEVRKKLRSSAKIIDAGTSDSDNVESPRSESRSESPRSESPKSKHSWMDSFKLGETRRLSLWNDQKQ